MQKEPVHILTDLENEHAIYGSFKQRALASCIDGLLLSPLLVVDWYNKTGWKSQLLLTAVFMVSLLYKPFFEFWRGATPGKKWMKLLVVNDEHLKVSLQQVLIRNIFDISSRIYYYSITLYIYQRVGFEYINTNTEYVKFQKEFTDINLYLLLSAAITVIEIILILSDKKKRALHDRMAGTLVIKKV